MSRFTSVREFVEFFNKALSDYYYKKIILEYCADAIAQYINKNIDKISRMNDVDLKLKIKKDLREELELIRDLLFENE